jgi:hypothetical protein
MKSGMCLKSKNAQLTNFALEKSEIFSLQQQRPHHFMVLKFADLLRT